MLYFKTCRNVVERSNFPHLEICLRVPIDTRTGWRSKYVWAMYISTQTSAVVNMYANPYQVH